MRSLILAISIILLLGNVAYGQSTVLSSVDFEFDKSLLCSYPREAKLTYTGIVPNGIGSVLPDHDFGNSYVVYSPDYTFEWQWGNAIRRSGVGLGPFDLAWIGTDGLNISLTVTSTASPQDKVTKTKKIKVFYLDVTAKWQDATCSTHQGWILINAADGTAPYQYSVDGTNFQDDSLFDVNPDTYKITIKDANNCVASKELTINGPDKPWVITVNDTTLCPGEQMKLSTSSYATTFLWEPATGLDNPTSKDPVAKPLSTTRYIVTTTNNNCMGIAKDTVLITVVPDFTLNITPDSEIEAGTSLQLNANSPELNQTTGVSYIWSPPTGLNDPGLPDPVTTTSKTTVYSIKVTTKEGCSATDDVKITVIPRFSILIPTAFSPNDDGTNDILKPFIHDDTSLLHFKIFNRWGEVIFFSKDKEKGWDGRVGGTYAASGSYAYKIEGVTNVGEIVKKEGAVLLLR